MTLTVEIVPEIEVARLQAKGRRLILSQMKLVGGMLPAEAVPVDALPFFEDMEADGLVEFERVNGLLKAIRLKTR